MWELLVFLFLGYISLYVLDPLFQREMEQTNRLQYQRSDKQKNMHFPSSHISTSLITPENSPSSSRIVTRPSTPSVYSRRSLFSNEHYD